MSNVIYEASVYARTISYKNFKGDIKEIELTFALDPISLLREMASLPTPKQSRSKSPAKKAQEETELSNEQQLKFLVDIASRAAGFISDDGESFEPFEDFRDSLAGKAFITKLASSDGDREEFAQKVMIDPFEAFVNYAKADKGNTPAEIKQFEDMLASMKRIFAINTDENLSREEKAARLRADLKALEAPIDSES